jgi:hypothetical protein
VRDYTEKDLILLRGGTREIKGVISIAVAVAEQSYLVPVAGRSVTEKLEVAAGNCRIEFIFLGANLFPSGKVNPLFG